MIKFNLFPQQQAFYKQWINSNEKLSLFSKTVE